MNLSYHILSLFGLYIFFCFYTTTNYLNRNTTNTAMGKKRFLIVLFSALFCIAFPVLADITINPPAQTTYNFGDTITLSGDILQTTDNTYLFKLILSCDTDQQLVVKTLSLTANAPYPFSETFTLLNTPKGTCTIRAELHDQGTVIDHTNTNAFTVTGELNGKFSLDKYLLKLGDTITIGGDITTMSGDPVEGTATILFQQNGQDFHADTIPINKGTFAHTYKTQHDPAGTYDLKVNVLDKYGNKQTFVLDPFRIESGIEIIAQADPFHVLPGEKIRISGETSLLDLPLSSGTITADLNNDKYTNNIRKGRFSFKIPVSGTITSGKHDVRIRVADDHGNIGGITTSFIVDPLPTRMDITTNKETYIPGDIVDITATLIDQANEAIPRDINITVITPDNVLVLNDIVFSGMPLEFKLLSTAIHGIWTLKAFYEGVEHAMTLEVQELPALTAFIQHDELIIHNTGNVKYKGPLEITITNTDQSSTMVKDLSLHVNETTTIFLAKEIIPGTYDITVGEYIFENVIINDGGPRGMTYILYLIMIIVVILLVYTFIYLRKQRPGTLRGQRKRERLIGDNDEFVSQTAPAKRRSLHKRRTRVQSDNEHVALFKQNMAMASSNKKALQFKLKKRGTDDYIYELPPKTTPPKEEPTPTWGGSPAEERERENQQLEHEWESQQHQTVQSFDQAYDEYEKSYEERERKREQHKDATEEKKGLFTMFD